MKFKVMGNATKRYYCGGDVKYLSDDLLASDFGELKFTDFKVENTYENRQDETVVEVSVIGTVDLEDENDIETMNFGILTDVEIIEEIF